MSNYWITVILLSIFYFVTMLAIDIWLAKYRTMMLLITGVIKDERTV